LYEFLRKYRVKYLEKQQKKGKIYFFSEKKMLSPLFCAEKQIFLVILRPKYDRSALLYVEQKNKV